MRKVSIIGIGETKIGKLDLSLAEMMKQAGCRAIADAGINKEMIQAVFVGNFNSSYLCNQSHIGPMASQQLELGYIPAVRTEGACASGGMALRMGYLSILSGQYDVVLVGGAEKMTHQPGEFVTSAVSSAMDYESEYMEGMTFPANFAMMANRYFHEYRNVKKEMGLCAVQAHHNACLNPDAQLPKELSLEKVLNAGMIADPLSIYDCSLVSDGAAFAVLAAAEIAESVCPKRIVDIVGSGHAGDALTLAAKPSLTCFPATQTAAKQAYEQAGLKPADIQFAEVHDCFTITQIINIEDLGFFEKGKGGDAVAAGRIAMEGKMPVNTSGGLKAKGHPIGATGISQVFEVVTQLRGEAGERQLPKADIGLAHNLGGTAGTCIVTILKGR